MKEEKTLVIVEKLNTSEKEEILAWAKNVKEIQNDKNLNVKDKIKSLKELDNKTAFISLGKIIKTKTKKSWKNASWAKRLGVIGASGALLTVSGSGAGIAALGGAIGLPLFLVTAAGGTLIGTLIDELSKNKK
ncbi:hypothetical protein [Lacinutrix sp. MEBiC02595]